MLKQEKFIDLLGLRTWYDEEAQKTYPHLTEPEWEDLYGKPIKYLKIIAKKIKKHNGCLLIFDYGYTENRNKDTLQSIKKHKYTNILSEPGNADITSHINYKLFSNIMKKNNLNVEKVVSQSKFLQTMGIIRRANIISKKMNFKSKADMFFRLKKLLHYQEMGSLIKVLLAQKKKSKFSLGFN